MTVLRKCDKIHFHARIALGSTYFQQPKRREVLMSETAHVAVNSNSPGVLKPPQTTFTDIQYRLARDEKVPIRDLPGITENDEKVLATVGVRTVQDLIFCANKRIFGAFGGKGNSGARRTIKRINTILCKHAFARKTPRRE